MEMTFLLAAILVTLLALGLGGTSTGQSRLQRKAIPVPVRAKNLTTKSKAYDAVTGNLEKFK